MCPKKCLPIPRVLGIFSFRNILVLAFICISDPFWVNFCIRREIQIEVYIFPCEYPVLQHHLLGKLSSSPSVTLVCLSKTNLLYVGLFLNCILFHRFICLFFCCSPLLSLNFSKKFLIANSLLYVDLSSLS